MRGLGGPSINCSKIPFSVCHGLLSAFNFFRFPSSMALPSRWREQLQQQGPGGIHNTRHLISGDVWGVVGDGLDRAH